MYTFVGRRSGRQACLGFVVLLLSGCATAGSTLGSGVGDKFLEHPPYYAGARVDTREPSTAIGYLPATYQRGGSQSPIFDPAHSPAMTRLLRGMDEYLDSLRIGRRLAEGGSVSAVTHAATRVPPDVYFGCITESGRFDDDCQQRGDSVLGRSGQTMRLAVGRPSTEWVSWINELMAASDVDKTLIVTLEIGQYLTRQRGLAGHKEVELGTSYVVRLPWLTSLETPVSVIQLTGALIDADGKAVRIGAEGLLPHRTTLPMSSLGMQALITDEDVSRLLDARREDLNGAPLAWQVGLQNLVDRLIGPRADRLASQH